MLVIGAKGHAKEILDILDKQQKLSGLLFFDNVDLNVPDKLYHRFPVVRTEDEAKKIFLKDPYFIIGIGGCQRRYNVARQFAILGGVLQSVIAHTASVGNFNVELQEGLNIMSGVYISNEVSVGRGTLVNAKSLLHHNVSIGEFCEISPNVTITGNVSIGDYTTIGAGCTILPNVKIGSNVIIGAGSVVTRDILENDVTAFGVPAKTVKKNPQFIK